MHGGMHGERGVRGERGVYMLKGAKCAEQRDVYGERGPRGIMW